MKSLFHIYHPKCLALVMLLGLVSESSFALEATDFNLDEEGTVVVVNHRKGVRMHLDYVGEQLSKPLDVSVKAEHEGLKVRPRTCRFSPKKNTCELTLQYTSKNKPVYGHQTIIVGSDAPPAPLSISFNIATKSAEAPTIIHWQHQGHWAAVLQKGVVVIQNGTDLSRVYQGNIRNYPFNKPKTTAFTLPSKSICYLDEFVLPTNTYIRDNGLEFESATRSGGLISGNRIADITNPAKPSFNDFYVKYDTKHVSTCSAMGEEDCAGGRWASWTLGLFNLSDQGLYDPDANTVFMPGTERILRNHSWNNGESIYFDGQAWKDYNVALVLIQGNIDGYGFDPEPLRLTQNQVASAPPCSSYVNK